MFLHNNLYLQIVLGIGVPVDLAIKTRQLIYVHNFHLQYVPPPDPLYWWSFYNTTTFVARHKRFYHPEVKGPLQLTNNENAYRDVSREFIYEVMETMLQRYEIL